MANLGYCVTNKKDRTMDIIKELGLLVTALLCVAFWLGIASFFMPIDWMVRLPEMGLIAYLVLSWLLNGGFRPRV